MNEPALHRTPRQAVRPGRLGAARLLAGAAPRRHHRPGRREGGPRPHYLTPLRATADPVTDNAGEWIGSPTDWQISSGYQDAADRRLSQSEEMTILGTVYGDGGSLHGPGSPLERYLADHGLRHSIDYHPAARFWPFQLNQAGIYVGLAAGLLVAAMWLIRRRTT